MSPVPLRGVREQKVHRGRSIIPTLGWVGRSCLTQLVAKRKMSDLRKRLRLPSTAEELEKSILRHEAC